MPRWNRSQPRNRLPEVLHSYIRRSPLTPGCAPSSVSRRAEIGALYEEGPPRAGRRPLAARITFAQRARDEPEEGPGEFQQPVLAALGAAAHGARRAGEAVRPKSGLSRGSTSARWTGFRESLPGAFEGWLLVPAGRR